MKKLLSTCFILLSLNVLSQVSFQANQTDGCAPAGVIISVTSPDPATITSYLWTITFPDNSTFTSTSPEYVDILSDPGSYTVSLTINGNETVTEVDYITVHDIPHPNFTVDDTEGCLPMCVQFTDVTDQSGGLIVEWSWDFGNGATSSIQNPAYCYNNTGIYSPILSVENENGCFNDTVIYSMIEVVDDFPTADFTPSSLATCNPPSTVDFENNSSGNSDLNCEWDFDDGFTSTTVIATDVAHTFQNLGFYDVCLEVTEDNGCSAEFCTEIEVFAAPAALFNVSSDVVCAGDSLLFESTSTPTPTTVEWDINNDGFIDGTGLSFWYTFTETGIFDPSMTAYYSPTCFSEDSQPTTVEVFEALNIDFAADTTFACQVPFDVNFINASTGPGVLSYDWFINGGGVGSTTDLVNTFTDFGTYDVTLAVSNDLGCNSQLTLEDLVVISTPTVSFTLPEVVCTNEVVELESIEIDSEDPIIDWEWDFDGDNVPDAGTESPEFVYVDPGEYFVSVTVTTENGCVSDLTSSSSILVQPETIAELTSGPTIGCAGEAVEFCTNTVEGTNYSWNFGDGSGWTTIGYPMDCVMHDYQDTGYFDITLSVYNLACGTYLELEQYLYIEAPVALFDYEQDCSDPTLVTFTDTSIEADSLIWDFGDGSPLVYNDTDPVYQYATPGIYTVTLTAFNDNLGCPDERIYTIDATVSDIPISYWPLSGCPPLDVGFNSTALTSYPHWEVDFGNGVTLVSDWMPELNQWHTYIYFPDGNVEFEDYSFNANFLPFIEYTEGGEYDIQVDVIDWSGCAHSSTYTQVISVYNDLLFASFDINIIDDCDAVIIGFEPTGQDLDTWEWQFSDGSVSSELTPINEWFAPWDTAFVATFSAQDINGCSSEVTTEIPIIPPPIPYFSLVVNPNCENEAVEVLNESSGDIVAYTWDFGDPASGALNTSSEENTSHIYASNGSYSICLSAENSAGCVQTICQNNLVNINSPIAEIAYTSNINNCLYGVQFENVSQGNIVSTQWDFGDGQGAMGDAVFHTYPIGVFDVELVVINDLGCADSTYIYDLFNLGDVVGPYSVNLDNVNCAPFQTSFEAYNTGDVSFNYFWDFGDGFGDPEGNTTTTHTYDTPGEYCPALIMEDPNGCNVLIECEEPIVVEEFTFDASVPEPVCFGESEIVTVSGADSYSWSDYTFVTETGPEQFELEAPVSTTLLVTGYYEDCEYEQEVTLVVNQLPDVQLVIPSEVCYQDDIFTLDGGSPTDGVGSYFIDGNIALAFDPSAMPNTNYEVVYSFEDLNGCVSADTADIFINALPQVSLDTFDAAACANGSPVPLSGGLPSGGVFSFEGAEISEFDPSIGWGNYSLVYTYTDENNCSATAGNTIQINPPPELSFTAEDFCFGPDLVLENTSSIPLGDLVSATWDFGTMGSSDLIQPAPVTPEFPGIYDITLSMTSSEGCTETLTQSVQAFTSPVAAFNFDDQCLSEAFTFEDVSEVLGGTSTEWNWSIDGDVIGNANQVSAYQFSEWGTYPVTLVVGSNEGCLDSITQMVNVYPLPEPAFSADDLCMGEEALIQSNSSIPDGSIENLEWNSPVTGVQTGPVFNYGFNEVGLYDLTLTATSDQGCVASMTQSFEVFPSPLVDFIQSDSAGCDLQAVIFEDQSYVEGSNIVAWAWYANGSLFSGQPNGIFVPEDPGTYDIQLFVTSANGCISDTIAEAGVELYPNPLADFSYSPEDPDILDPIITISDESEGAMSWEYTLPNGQTILDPEFELSYDIAGNYPIQLIVTNEYGCQDSLTLEIHVEPHLLVFVPNAFTPDNDGYNDTFFPVLNLDVAEYSFLIFDRWGEIVFSSENPHEPWLGQVQNGGHYAQDGVYSYRLVVRDDATQELHEFIGHVTLIR